MISYSDQCSAQNGTLCYPMYCVIEPKMQCNSEHSSIEARKKIKNQRFKTSLQIRKKKIKYVDYTFFLNLSDLKHVNSIRPGKQQATHVLHISEHRYQSLVVYNIC